MALYAGASFSLSQSVQVEMLGLEKNLILSRQSHFHHVTQIFGYVRVLLTGGLSFITYIGYCEKCTKYGCIGARW